MTLVYTFGSGECEQLGTYHSSIFIKVRIFLAAFEPKLRRMKAIGHIDLSQLSFFFVFPKMIWLFQYFRIGWWCAKWDQKASKNSDFRAGMFGLWSKINHQSLLWWYAHSSSGEQRNPLLLGLQWRRRLGSSWSRKRSWTRRWGIRYSLYRHVNRWLPLNRVQYLRKHSVLLGLL